MRDISDLVGDLRHHVDDEGLEDIARERLLHDAMKAIPPPGPPLDPSTQEYLRRHLGRPTDL